MKVTAVIDEIYDLITPVTTQWIIIGTASLLLQGYPVEPNYIDILCNEETADLIAKSLSVYRIATKAGLKRDKFRSAYSQYYIKGCVVELMGNLEVNTPDGWIQASKVISATQEIFVNNKSIKVPDKNSQQRLYHFFGREKDQAVLQMLSCY